MKHITLIPVIVPLLLLTSSPRATAGLIVDQPPFVGAGGPASDTAFINDYGEDSWEISADEFISPANATVNRVVWWGFYGGNNPAGSFYPPTGDETMRIRLYEPRPGNGLPGSIQYETTVLNAPRTATGRFYGPHPEFRFESDLVVPFAMSQSGHYWFEVTQIDDAKSIFRRFRTPDSVTPYAYFNNWVSDWDRVSGGGLAFQLWEIPEPSTFSFVAVIVFVISRKGVRMKNPPLAGFV